MTGSEVSEIEEGLSTRFVQEVSRNCISAARRLVFRMYVTNDARNYGTGRGVPTPRAAAGSSDSDTD